MSSKLPSLKDLKALDGESETTELKSSRCIHKNAQIVSSQELRCTCGANWHGQDIQKLYTLLTN